MHVHEALKAFFLFALSSNERAKQFKHSVSWRDKNDYSDKENLIVIILLGKHINMIKCDEKTTTYCYAQIK